MGQDDKTLRLEQRTVSTSTSKKVKPPRTKPQPQPQANKEPNKKSATEKASAKPELPKHIPKQVPKEKPVPKRDSPASSPILAKDLSELKKKRANQAPRGHVRFHSVELKEYAVTLGDHPMCKVLPLTLDWSHSTPVEFTINDYEASRKAKFELHMDVRDRFERLTLVSGMSENMVARLEQTRRRSLRKSE